MGKNRFFTVGVVLFLSMFISVSGRADDRPAGDQAPKPAPADSPQEGADPPIPTAPDPWALLQSTPGVLVDRINVGGNESGCSSPEPIQEPAAAVGQGFQSADELIATDMAVAGSLPSELDFNAFTEMPVETGLADSSQDAPETRLRPRRGTNEWRAWGFMQGSDGRFSADRRAEAPEGAVEGNRIDALRSGSAQIGGPLVEDRFWLWGEAGFHQVDRIVLGGEEEERSGSGGRFKLNSQIITNISAVLAGSRGDSSGSGVGAAPGRAPETTWDEDGREAVWATEATAIASSNLYFTGGLGRVDRRLADVPEAAGGEARIGADGVARGSWFDLRQQERTRQARLVSDAFADTASVSHEIVLGGGWLRREEDRTLTAPVPVAVAGRILGRADGLALAELWRAGKAAAHTETLGLWTQDTLFSGSWTAVAGLQADRQDFGVAGSRRPWTLLPRLGLNRALGADRMTQIWASLSRFASQLGPRAAWHTDPAAPAVLRSLFADLDGDLILDPGEPIQVLPGEGIDPLRPGIDPDAVDPRLRPEITNQAVLGVQSILRSDFQVGLRAAWRRTRHLLEERLLVRDGATGEVFPATSGDWLPAGRMTGVLPDGTPYDVPYWDLRPGLLWTGGTLLVNGDREREDLGLSLIWKKRLANRWMSQGHVTWSGGEQHLGPAFRRFDDPTNTLGGGDDEGRPVAESASGRPHEAPSFPTARWSFHALGFVRLRDAGPNLAVALNGRQGYPLPYYRQVARERAGIAQVQLTGRPDAVRTDDVLTVDAQLEQELTLRDTSLTLSLEVSNLLNEDSVLARELDLGTGRAAFADEALAARSLRLKVRMSWR